MPLMGKAKRLHREAVHAGTEPPFKPRVNVIPDPPGFDRVAVAKAIRFAMFKGETEVTIHKE